MLPCITQQTLPPLTLDIFKLRVLVLCILISNVFQSFELFFKIYKCSGEVLCNGEDYFATEVLVRISSHKGKVQELKKKSIKKDNIFIARYLYTEITELVWFNPAGS